LPSDTSMSAQFCQLNTVMTICSTWNIPASVLRGALLVDEAAPPAEASRAILLHGAYGAETRGKHLRDS